MLKNYCFVLFNKLTSALHKKIFVQKGQPEQEKEAIEENQSWKKNYHPSSHTRISELSSSKPQHTHREI